MKSQKTIHRLYKKLIDLYPGNFQAQLGESMEQTFQDLWNEKRQKKKELFGFVLWTFSETAMGIFREHLLLISPGDIMRATLKTLGSSALISLLLILPFMVMEVVNRQNFNEEFPIALFFGLWLSLFAISLILLPIMRARRTGNHDMANPVPTQGNISSRSEAEWTLLTNPKSAAIIGIVIILSIAAISLLASPGGESPEQNYVFGIQVPSQFIALVSLFIPIAGGVIASKPIIRTLQVGGSLFAHPINLIIVVTISLLFAVGAINLIVDQWPCFMGVPVCD